MALIVQKYGGSSVADAEKIKNVARRVAEQAPGNQLVVVVSAMGKTPDGLIYVTGPGGVWVGAPDGTPLGILRLPVAATNVAFYGYDAKILFVTAPPALFVVRLARPGISVLDRIR